ncbi:MAG: sulfotransferase family 2 domain-containing protein [Marinoscillum sp.]|uniref:sulfotransferase family 2 domain-containing protein n=3 Tax=Marinoscillum sp. TaxID=2024838 RepID=UPI0032F8A1D7
MNEKLISIHIPKTAGTSFRHTLIDVYGIERVMPFYYPDKSKISYKIPKRIRVLHGHISSHDYDQLIKQNPEWEKAKVISWVRDPVDRFISNYFYMKDIVCRQLDNFNKDTPDLKKRMVRTLDDFIQRPNERDEMVRFINEQDLVSNKFSFIGDVSNYDEDLQLLAFILGWKAYRTYQHNTTKGKEKVDNETRNRIRNILEGDMNIYDEVTAWRRTHQKATGHSGFTPAVSIHNKLKLRNRAVGRVLSLFQKIR